MTNPTRFDGGALGGSIVVNVMAPRKVGKIPFNSEDDTCAKKGATRALK